MWQGSHHSARESFVDHIGVLGKVTVSAEKSYGIGYSLDWQTLIMFQLPYGVEVSDHCRELILALLQRDPEKRISFQELFVHPFLDLEHMPSKQCLPKAVSNRLINTVFQILFTPIFTWLFFCNCKTLKVIFNVSYINPQKTDLFNMCALLIHIISFEHVFFVQNFRF